MIDLSCETIINIFVFKIKYFNIKQQKTPW